MTTTLLKLAAAAAMLFATPIGWAATDPPGHVADLPPLLESQVEALASSLRTDGFEVALGGYAKEFPIEACKFPIHIIGNCLGNNPTAPYVFIMVPPWRDEYVDRSLHLVAGPVHGGNEPTYRLGQRDALVLLLQLPPPAAYFGVQSYVFTRKGTVNQEDEVYQEVARTMPGMLDLLFATAPDPSRVITFSSIGNANNNVVMGDPWGQQRFIIITPDADMTKHVTDALTAGGVDPAHVFTEPVAADLVRLGLDADADDFVTAVRYAMAQDETAAEIWRQAPTIGVLRVRDTKHPADAKPYRLEDGDAVYESRSAESEEWLTEPLDQLATALKQDLGGSKCERTFGNPYLEIDLIGQHCLGRPMNCLGDTQDTDTYHSSYDFLIDPPGKTVAIVGTLATVTHNATYVSLSINRASVFEGVENISNLQLDGSAMGFEDDVPDKDTLSAFYVVYLSRQCPKDTKARCYEISEDLIPSGEAVKVIQRNYIKPGTRRGADVSKNGNVQRPRLISPDSADCPPS